jgi:hypothetical protein
MYHVSQGMKLTEIICDVETRRARPSDLGEVRLALIRLARVYELSARKEDEFVEESDDVGAGLVDRKDHGTLVRPRELYKRFDDVEGVVRVESFTLSSASNHGV